MRLLVIGAGHMGQLYTEKIRLFSNTGRVELAAVVDLVESRAQAAAGSDTPSGNDYRGFLNRADGVIIATPTASHCEIAVAAMRAGLDVLVEKPIADSLTAAERMKSTADSTSRVLHVGHQEWWNPAVQAVIDYAGHAHQISIQREGPYSGRGADDDVVVDLMIHDIHIVQSMLGEEPSRISGVGTRVVTASIDEAHAELEFSSRRLAKLTASRVATRRTRTMRLELADVAIDVDLLSKSARLRRHGVDDAGEEISLPTAESDDDLTLQLGRFVDSILRRETCNGIDAAIAALRTALRVVDAINAKSTDAVKVDRLG